MSTTDALARPATPDESIRIEHPLKPHPWPGGDVACDRCLNYQRPSA